MEIFATFISFLTRQPAAITVLFFYAMDHLLGNVAFECPCILPKELRRHFALVLLICPALIILLIDIPWSLLSSIIKAQRCCCREACGGALMAVLQPLGLSVAWVFIFQESTQFSVCINATNIQNLTGCIEDSNSTEYIIRTCSVVLLCLMTAALGVRAIIQCLAPFCNYCCKSCWKSCCKSCGESCCKSSCKCCSKSCSTSSCSSYLKSFCESCCNCLTIHPNSDLLKENLSFSTFRELDREYLLIENELLTNYSVESIDKLNIGQGQQVRLKNSMNSPRDLKGRVQSLQASNIGPGIARVTWIPPNDIKGQDSGYIIQYKIKDLKQRRNQQNRQQEKSTAKLSGLEYNVRYSIQIWVIKTSDLCNSEKKSFCSIEICTTETTDKRDFTPTGDKVLSGEVSKFSLIQVTRDSVYLVWNLGKEDQERFIGYELQYKIVKNQNHVDMQQSKTEMSAEFSTLHADVVYRCKIWACNGNTKGESSSIEIDGAPGPVKSLKASNNGRGRTRLTWIAPSDVKEQGSGYIIRYEKVKDLKHKQNQQNGQQENSTAKLSGLGYNLRYSIKIWVIKTCCRCCSKKESFCSIEICTTKYKEPPVKYFPKDKSDTPSSSNADDRDKRTPGDIYLSGEVSMFSLIEVTDDSVYLEWNLGKEHQEKFIGYELQYKIVKNQDDEDKLQSKTEMSAEFSTLQADALYRCEIWACYGKTKRESSSIKIYGGHEMHTYLLCNTCSKELDLESNDSNAVQMASSSASGDSPNAAEVQLASSSASGDSPNATEVQLASSSASGDSPNATGNKYNKYNYDVSREELHHVKDPEGKKQKKKNVSHKDEAKQELLQDQEHAEYGSTSKK